MWKAEEMAGRENPPALGQLILLSSRAPAQAGQGNWVGTVVMYVMLS